MRIFLFILLLLALPSGAAFADADYAPPYTVLKDRYSIIVHADATSEAEREYLMRIDTEPAATTYATATLSYDGSRESLELREAWTEQPDGRRIGVAADGVRIQGDPMSLGSPVFSDAQNLVIVFPEVRKGSRLYYRVKSREFKPRFPGKFDFMAHFPSIVTYEDVEIELRHDPRIAVRVAAPGMTGGELPPQGGMKRHRYRYQSREVWPDEEGQVDSRDFAPQFQAGSFEGYGELARLYEQRAAPLATVTPRLRELASDILRAASVPEDAGRREQARALYDWVSRNIRYVYIGLGNGGVVPHAAGEIAAAGYGDCKDHATLLQALLAARGIDSTQVLIEPGRSYELQEVPGLGTFSHVINYLPEFDLYLDSTWGFWRFGALSASESDKPVLLTASGRIARTPVARAENNRLEVRLTLKMRPDGAIEGRSRIEAVGDEESLLRNTYNSLAALPQDAAVSGLLAAQGETGQGSYRTSDPTDLAVPFVVDAEFLLDAPANVPGPGAIALPAGISPGYLKAEARARQVKQRRFPHVCPPVEVTEQVELEFPPNVSLLAIPKDAELTGPGRRYAASYRLNGRTLTAIRHYRREFPRGSCPPGNEQAELAFAEGLRRDLRAQVVYR